MITNNTNISNLSVYERISHKARNAINNLSADEREILEDQLIESYSSRIAKLTDEDLLQYAMDKGEIL